MVLASMPKLHAPLLHLVTQNTFFLVFNTPSQVLLQVSSFVLRHALPNSPQGKAQSKVLFLTLSIKILLSTALVEPFKPVMK